ncbi:hypothetical protein CCYS_11885 [Corynebacterium cystitidis DSM 20524]|uniref:Histone n=1 Tax=Corynebacterium cystitidis DSM 20524 TaxID=1121357 RepID=A0A1H9W922_9CORY|nr:hypothetical protein CCYS_11885 [Corynebacterium cystitidis DSM 20524]SES30291.1 hypothetical protein SAMN05661109_02601 [Corynebacterium cystitidis DSM 20524]SNV64114.1 Uncharacterised protein [Corynebacterium cystitidis]
MPPKITDSRPSPEEIHELEQETALGARRIVATYAEDLLDGVMLMSMLGVEPQGLVYKKFEEELAPEETAASAGAKKTTKKATKKKATKKTTKKATKKKATKKTTKKATKKKATKKAAKKSSGAAD